MLYRRKYGKLIIVILAGIWYLNQIPSLAAETGTISTMSERVYERMDESSGVVANVIMDSPFSLLSAEYDDSGNVWYRIRTNMGAEGYIPARNVRVNGTDSETEGAEEAGGQSEESAAEEERPEDGADPFSPEQETDREGVGQDRERGTAGETETSDSSMGERMETDRQVRTIESVNMRRDSAISSDIVGRIPPGVTLNCIGVQKNEIGENWYEIFYEGVHGYVRESTVDVIDRIPPQEAGRNEQNGEGSHSEDETALSGGETSSGSEKMPNGEESFQTQEAAGTEALLGTKDSAGDGKAEVQDVGMGDSDGGMTEDVRPDHREKKWRFYIDWVVVGVFLGCFLCMMALRHLIRQIRKLYRGKSKKERMKECLPNKRKRHT